MKIKNIILLLMLVTIFATILVISAIDYRKEQHILFEWIDGKLFDIANVAPLLIPEHYHDDIIDENSVTPEEYKAIVQKFSDLCKELGIQYVWSVMEIDGRYVFTTASSTSRELNTRDCAAFFETHSNPESMQLAFDTMEVQYTTFHNEWGEGRMVLVPHRDSRGRKYLFGASMSMDMVTAANHSTIITWVYTGLLALMVGSLMSIFVARIITRPITSFAGEVREITTHHYNRDIEIKGSREVRSLAVSINNLMKSLRESREELRQIIDILPAIVHIKDSDGRYIISNIAHAELFGKTVDEIIGKTFADISSDPKMQERVLAEDKAVIETGEPLFEPDYSLTDLTGLKRYYQLAKIPCTLHTTGEPAVLCVASDITNHKRLESQLLQAQKMETVGRLAGGIAHDFNNIITAISGYAELAMMSLPEDDPLTSDIREIQAGANRAADLTRQLLAFSRRQIIEPKILNLNETIENLDKMLRRLLGEDIDYSTVLTENLWSVKLDPGQIEQVMTNLVVNSRDAMPEGGKLTIETANIILDREYTKRHSGVTPGEYVMLAVSDSGSGMSDEVRQKVFEPFFTTKEKGKGTGLGLSTCYGIVKQNNGFIWIYSEEEYGTTIKIYLPRAKEDTSYDDSIQPSEKLLNGTETVLVVEDERAVRKMIIRVLKDAGYTVLDSQNGEAALEDIAEFRPGDIDLLITDVVMPKMGGRELAEIMTKTHTDMKVIFMSGYTDNSIVHHGVLDSGLAFIQKPFTPNSLLTKTRQVLDT